jgi:HEAT repeat protein
MKFKTPIYASTIIVVAALSMSGHGAEPAQKSLATAPSVNTATVVPENVSSLIKELGNKDFNVRSRALESLGIIGTPAVPAIIQALSDTNSLIRKGAVDALGDIGNVKAEVLPALIKSLIDRDSYVRKSASDALCKIGAPAIPPIMKALTGEDSLIRKGAAEALGNMGALSPEIVPALIKALEDNNEGVRRAAVDSLGKIGAATPEVITALKKAVEDKNYSVRKSSVEVLEKKGNMTAELKVKRYIMDLEDTNSDNRRSAIEGLNKLGTSTPEVISAITTALGDSDYSVRKSSADFLEKRNSLTDALKSKRYIIDLKGGNKIIRVKAAESLGKTGAATPEVVPALIAALGDKDARNAAIEALGNIGAEAKDAVPALAKALSDTDVNVRTAAAEALGKIGPSAKSAVAPLMKALKDSDPAVSENAANALEKIGAMTLSNKLNFFTFSHPFITAFGGIAIGIVLLFASWYAVPVFFRFFFPMKWHILQLHSNDSKQRAASAQALGKIGKPAIIPLIKALSHNNSNVRISASDALNKIGPVPPKAIPLILRSLRDKESEVRKNITEILGKTGALTTDVIPALIRVIGDSDSYVRASAAEALGKCGSETPEVIPTLMKALGDSFYYVRDSAGKALEECSAMHVDLKVKRCITDFGESHTDILSRAIEELESIGPAAIPELIKAVGDPNSHIRRFAAAALEKQNALTSELKVKRYILDLNDNNTSVRTRAAEALGNMGATASESIPHLVKLIGNKDYYARWHAAEALEKLGALTPEIKIKKYILDLGDSNNDVRSKAADALCELGPDAKEALPKLKKLLEEDDEIIRASAEKAIAKIEIVQDPIVS